MGKRRAKIGQLNDIDLRLLRVFQAVVECRGLAAAELRLGINRSTISTHLSAIELRLGVRLCERGRSGFELTEDGKRVYAATNALMSHISGFQEELNALNGMPLERLRIALLDSFIWYDKLQISERLRQFTSKNKDTRIDIHIFHPEEIEQKLTDGSIDIGLTSIYDHSAKFEYVPLTTSESYLYCGSRNILFELPDDKITEAHLANTSYSSRWFDASPDLIGENAEVARVETFHIEATAHLILSGNYVGFLPEHYARLWVEQGLMRAVLPQKYRLRYKYGLAFRRDRHWGNAARAFIETMKAQVP